MVDSLYVANLLEYFGNGSEVLAMRHQGTDPDMMAILQKRGRFVWESFHPAQAPLGLWLQTSDFPDKELGKLMRALPGFSILLGTHRQDPALHPRPTDKGRVRTLDSIETSALQVEGSFDAFWQQREPKYRQETDRRRRRATKKFGEPRLQEMKRPEDVPWAIEQYGRIESAGWKGDEGTAISSDNKQGAFYRKVLEGFCAIGEGRIYVFWFGERLVSMQLAVERQGTLYLLKTTYDEGFRSYGPGVLMNFAILKSAFESSHITRIEFYGRLNEVQRKLDPIPRVMYHMNVFRSSWLATAIALTHSRR